MPYGYVDPLQQVRQQQASRRLVQPQFPAPAPFRSVSPWPPAPGGPLAGLQESVAGVLNAADSHHTYIPDPGGAMLQYPRGRQPSLARDMAYGAAAGFAGWLVWRQMKRRKAVRGEFTTPAARIMLTWWLPVAAAFALAMVWPMEAGAFLFPAFIGGFAAAMAYLIFRICGGGRFNTNRKGSPWRDDHRTGAHRSR